MTKNTNKKPAKLTGDPSLEDFGDDPTKATREAQVTQTEFVPSKVEFDAASTDAWHTQKNYPYTELAKAASRLIARGELVSDGEVQVTLGKNVTKPGNLVKVTAENGRLKVLMAEVDRFVEMESPLAKPDCQTAIYRARTEIEKQRGYHKGLDFTAADRLLTAAVAAYDQIKATSRQDFRKAVNLAGEAFFKAYDIANTARLEQLNRMVTNDGDTQRQAETQKKIAEFERLAKSGDEHQVENAGRFGFSIFRDMQTHGVQDPQWVARQEQKRRNDPRPSQPRGSGSINKGRSKMTFRRPTTAAEAGEIDE